MAKFNYKSSLSLFQTIFLISLTTVGTVVIMPRIVESQTPKKTSISPFCQTLSEKFSPFGNMGNSPDLYAALEQVIAKGGDLNQPCDMFGEKWLPLNFLLSTNEVLAQRLIQTGVNVNAKDSKGDTPLHYLGASTGSGTTTTKATAKLQQLLNAKNWKAADQETRRLLSPQKDPYGPNAATIPLNLIQEIDRAWLKASSGRFGFSVQAKIWQQAVAAHPKNSERAVNAFRDRVGWKLQAPRTENDFMSSDWLNESELNYSLQAPIGHLPWAGVADADVLSVAVPPPGQHCGSCTVDAMHLRHGRFYTYLPQLFARVKMALNISVPKK